MRAADEKDLSIIIPVYNAVDVLPHCLDSILAQTIDLGRVEVLLIDDGSTDGSAALCDECVAKNPALFKVVHQSNSGGPAAPRNRGIEEASGTYIFFCDNDDYFGREAFERMLSHAFEWESDVLLVKMGETGRRAYPRSMFQNSDPRADLYTSKVLKTLGPWKAYRRSLIIDNDIRFPEDCSLDDSVFTLEAYLRAETISVTADYDYYYWTIRDDGGNLSSQGGSAASVWRDVASRNAGCAKMLDLVYAYVPLEERAPFYDKILGGLAFNTLAIACADDSERSESNLKAMKGFFSNYAKQGCLEKLPFAKRAVFACAMDGNSPECIRAIMSVPPTLSDFRKVSGVYRCEFARASGVECHGCHALCKTQIRRNRVGKLKRMPVLGAVMSTRLGMAARRSAKKMLHWK